MRGFAALALSLFLALPGGDARPDESRARFERLVEESAAFAAVSDDLQQILHQLDSASSWIVSAAETGIEWDEAGMHGAAVAELAGPRLDVLRDRVVALTFEAPDMPPLYGGIEPDRDLMLASIELCRLQAASLEEAVRAARQRDAAGVFEAGEALDDASRAAIEMHDKVVREWLARVPADHPDYMLALAMIELTPLWQIDWPGDDDDISAWLSTYRESAALHERIGRRVGALGRAAGDAAPAFERALAALLERQGVAEPSILAANATREVIRQAAATERLGALLQERAGLLDRATALDLDPLLYKAFEAYEQKYGQVFLDLSRHFERRFAVLAEGVLR